MTARLVEAEELGKDPSCLVGPGALCYGNLSQGACAVCRASRGAEACEDSAVGLAACWDGVE
jgi:hypothetical protein